MASAEAKVVVIALLILAIGFFYTNVRDKMTGYVPAQRSENVDDKFITEEYTSAAEDLSDQTLPTEQQTTLQKELTKEEVSFGKIFPEDMRVDPCSNDIPSQIQTLVRSAC